MDIEIIKKFKSRLWFQDLETIQKNPPFDHENYKLFCEESSFLLDKLYGLYDEHNLKFHNNEKTLKKCLWMLQLDALDTLRECVSLLKTKKHKLPGKMFRDITESLDLSCLIRSCPEKYLEQWYSDIFIPHKEYRNYVGQKYGKEAEEREKENYRALSSWTHHGYYQLRNSYTLGQNDMLVYDSHCPDFLTPLQTISQYLWMIKHLIIKFIKEMNNSGMLDNESLEKICNEIN
jgi:hypothetical protein